jgi:hypothetical protein
MLSWLVWALALYCCHFKKTLILLANSQVHANGKKNNCAVSLGRYLRNILVGLYSVLQLGLDKVIWPITTDPTWPPWIFYLYFFIYFAKLFEFYHIWPPNAHGSWSLTAVGHALRPTIVAHGRRQAAAMQPLWATAVVFFKNNFVNNLKCKTANMKVVCLKKLWNFVVYNI